MGNRKKNITKKNKTRKVKAMNNNDMNKEERFYKRLGQLVLWAKVPSALYELFQFISNLF